MQVSHSRSHRQGTVIYRKPPPSCRLPSRLGLLNTLIASLQRAKTPSNECPAYDTKQYDGEASVMLALWEIRSTPSMPSLLSPLRPGVVAPDWVLPMCQIELNCVLMLN